MTSGLFHWHIRWAIRLGIHNLLDLSIFQIDLHGLFSLFSLSFAAFLIGAFSLTMTLMCMNYAVIAIRICKPNNTIQVHYFDFHIILSQLASNYGHSNDFV